MLMKDEIRRIVYQAGILVVLIGGIIPSSLQADTSASSSKLLGGKKPNVIIILADDMGWGDRND